MEVEQPLAGRLHHGAVGEPDAQFVVGRQGLQLGEHAVRVGQPLGKVADAASDARRAHSGAGQGVQRARHRHLAEVEPGQPPRHLGGTDQLAPHPGADLGHRHSQNSAELRGREQALQILHLVGEPEHLQERDLGDDPQIGQLLLQAAGAQRAAVRSAVAAERPCAVPYHQVGGADARLPHHASAGSSHPVRSLTLRHRRQRAGKRHLRPLQGGRCRRLARHSESSRSRRSNTGARSIPPAVIPTQETTQNITGSTQHI